MFKSSNFILKPNDTDLNLRIKDDNNRVSHLLKASSICRFHKEGDTIVINSSESTDPIYLKFADTTDATTAINKLYDSWLILKANYTASQVIPDSSTSGNIYIGVNGILVDNIINEIKLDETVISNRSLQSSNGLVLDWESGHVKNNFVKITNNYDVLTYEYLIIIDGLNSTNGTSGTSGITINLPPADVNYGREIYIKNKNTGLSQSTIMGYMSELIEGSNVYLLTSSNSYVKLFCDGEDWIIIGSSTSNSIGDSLPYNLPFNL